MNQPNIILINCDDLGYGDLPCYGSKINDAPNLSRFAEEGMRFTDFYMASAVCSASRAAMMTGCYSQRIGFSDYQVLGPKSAQGLNPNEKTIAKALKEKGYKTKIVGKWHCGTQSPFLPTQHGFDDYFGIPFSNDMGRQVGRLDTPPLPLMRGEEVIQEQPDQRGLTERYVDECQQFMRSNQQEPFFLYLAHMYVHVPLFVPKQFMDVSRNGAYGGAVACIDWAMGALDQELERLGLKENTLVIFTSDNGSRTNDEGGSNAPLRGTKAQTWEGGQRVPMMARWPGKIKAGTTCHGIASSIDLYSTLCDLTGAVGPEHPIDSQSLKSTLLEEAPTPRETFVYYKNGTLEAVRKGDWKLHLAKTGWNPAGGDSPGEINELYNLREDVGESNNLFDQNPKVVEELSGLAEDFREDFGDQIKEREGRAIRPIGVVDEVKVLTEYDENHPYMIAYYDLADGPRMSG
jgi:arylsulfatase A